jgi:hypothetical protein
MQRFRYWGALLLVPALAILVTVGGCGGGDKKGKRGKGDGGDDGDNQPEKVLKEREAKGTATVKGKAVFAGDKAPKREEIKPTSAPEDIPTCKKGDFETQEWKVREVDGKNLVANVVVWVEPPEGYYFKVGDKGSWPKEVSVDQPHCAFVPHVVVHFAKKYDPATKKWDADSGQKFVVYNHAPMAHNTHYSGSPLYNTENNIKLGKGEQKTISFNPDPKHISLNCDIHKWMSGYVWAFGHPYAAVTKEDKEKEPVKDFGTFEIKDAPAGVEVILKGWHEKGETINATLNGKKLGNIKGDGQKVTLEKGGNTLELEVEK